MKKKLLVLTSIVFFVTALSVQKSNAQQHTRTHNGTRGTTATAGTGTTSGNTNIRNSNARNPNARNPNARNPNARNPNARNPNARNPNAGSSTAHRSVNTGAGVSTGGTRTHKR